MKVDSVLIDVSDNESINAAVKEVEKNLNGEALDVLVVSTCIETIKQAHH